MIDILDAKLDMMFQKLEAVLLSLNRIEAHLGIPQPPPPPDPRYKGLTQEQIQKLSEVIMNNVSVLGLSVRVMNVITNEDWDRRCQTVGDLVSLTDSDLLRMRNFGKKSLREVKEKLSAIGLSLGMFQDSE